MKLHTNYRNRHGDYSLEELWKRACPDDAPEKDGMLGLIARLKEVPLDAEIYAVISMNSLVLMTEPDAMAMDWWVRVECIQWARPAFRIFALIPEEMAPWPNAYAYTEVYSLADAVDKVTIGIKYCGAWDTPG